LTRPGDTAIGTAAAEEIGGNISRTDSPSIASCPPSCPPRVYRSLASGGTGGEEGAEEAAEVPEEEHECSEDGDRAGGRLNCD